MKSLLYVLLLSFSLPSFSQTYHPLVKEGSVWSTLHRIFMWDFWTDYTKFEGDSILDGKHYLKVWKTTDEYQSGWEYSELIREDTNGNVYINWGIGDDLIYSFGASIGDTLFLHGSYEYYILDSIGTIELLNGEMRSIYFLSHEAGWCQETWIEGIGSNYGVLNGGFCGMTGDNPELLCFTEDEVLKYKNPSWNTCYYWTGTPELELNRNILISPNPTTGSISIRSSCFQKNPILIEITDPSGKLIYRTEMIIPDNEIILPEHIMNGLYFIKIVPRHSVPVVKGLILTR
ncbi:MAG: T9SS type A sorting domain-containing protein [Bacteroidetes bacterium]|nr:T9SS type A sorting domain-containing protein [Bacteroidota bacterium]